MVWGSEDQITWTHPCQNKDQCNTPSVSSLRTELFPLHHLVCAVGPNSNPNHIISPYPRAPSRGLWSGFQHTLSHDFPAIPPLTRNNTEKLPQVSAISIRTVHAQGVPSLVSRREH